MIRRMCVFSPQISVVSICLIVPYLQFVKPNGDYKVSSPFICLSVCQVCPISFPDLIISVMQKILHVDLYESILT